jgi:hypothetical protein
MPDTSPTATASTGSFIPIWQTALRDESAFAELVSRDVRLEGSIYAAPITGREKVWTVIRAAGAISDVLRFTNEAATTDRRYLEWELEALGLCLNGVSVISFDDSGMIDGVALHFRPLTGLLAFSAELGRRLGDVVGPDMFVPEPDES